MACLLVYLLVCCVLNLTSVHKGLERTHKNKSNKKMKVNSEIVFLEM